MKLSRLLKNISEDVVITYRTYGPNGEDLFAGMCAYDASNNYLYPLDGDSYSLEDEIDEFEYSWENPKQRELTVWYKSKWI